MFSISISFGESENIYFLSGMDVMICLFRDMLFSLTRPMLDISVLK